MSESSRSAFDGSDRAEAGEGAPLAAETGYHRVRDALRTDILAGVFSGDGRLKIRDLSERYGLSPAPIREALGQLEAEGLVELRANRGACVRPVTPEFVVELYEIRRALEPMLSAKAASAAAEGDVAALAALEADFETAVEAGDAAGIVAANRALHRRMQLIAPNREAMRLLAHHAALLTTIRTRFGFSRARLPQIVQEHRGLVDACARRDGDTAGALARVHITHSLNDLLDRMAGAGSAIS